jgi:hypothetical protein
VLALAVPGGVEELFVEQGAYLATVQGPPDPKVLDQIGARHGPDAGTPDPRHPGPLGSETGASCRDHVILVDETAESVPAPNAGGDCYRIRPSPNLDTSGRPKREASVRPLVVVVPQVLVEHPLKMTPTPGQHPIQTLLPHLVTQRSANALAFGA